MKNKVILDEMQQRTLLEIEHKTLYITLTGLLIVILMQQIFWKDLLLQSMGCSFQTCLREIARVARYSSPASTQRGSWLRQRRGAVGSPVKKKSRKPFCDFLLCNVVVRRWGIKF